MKRPLLALILSCLCLPAYAPAHAEEPAARAAASAASPADAAKPDAGKPADTAQKPADGADLKAADNFKEKAETLKADLSSKLEALRTRLNEKQNRHFGIIYNNHNLIETVKTVEGDVGKAVTSCSEKNPDLAEKMKSRFDDWKGAVNGKLKEAEDLTSSMVLAQDYAGKDEINAALKASDTMRAHSQTIYEKVPVTSHEACEFLYEKMQETKDNMVSLLGTTLISVPQEMQKADEAKPDNKKPDEEKPADVNPAEAKPEPEKAPEAPAADTAPAKAP